MVSVCRTRRQSNAAHQELVVLTRLRPVAKRILPPWPPVCPAGDRRGKLARPVVRGASPYIYTLIEICRCVVPWQQGSRTSVVP